jgi:acetyl esterase/lipase
MQLKRSYTMITTRSHAAPTCAALLLFALSFGALAQQAAVQPKASAVAAKASAATPPTVPPELRSDDPAAPSTIVPRAIGPKPLEFKNIAYGHRSGVDQILDAYIQPTATDAAPAPVLVYFHGGAWNHGQRPATYGSFRAFLAMGFSVVSVDYRLAAVATAPAAVQDARCALAWVKANAAKYHFDVNRVVPYGTSAGGQMALMAGMLPIPSDLDSPECKDVPKAAAILDFYGPAELRSAMDGAFKSPSVLQWIGNQPNSTAYASLMSPITYVRAGLPPVYIVHGGSDPVVPHANSEHLQAALNAAGVPNEFYTVPNGQHGQFSHDQMDIISAQIYTFLQDNKVLPLK